MMQPDFMAEIITLCKQQGIHTAIDTCGHAEPAAFMRVMDLAYLFLFDIKLMDDAKHVEFTGVSNELALKNLEMISRAGKNIIIRFPVIPGITDDPENIEAIIALMQGLHLKNIDLLPYHSIAKDKYRRIGRQYLLEDMHEPNEEKIEKLRAEFNLRLSAL